MKKTGWGYYVTIKDEDDTKYSTRYAHFASQSTLKVGDKVRAGDPIGTAGNTGGSTGVHLHFEIMDDKEDHQNPRKYLAESFPEDFSRIVDAGSLEGEIEGDYRDNTLIANSRSNTLEGLEGSDTYSFSSIAGLDVIIDSDNDGTIKIGGKVVSGSIQPKVDELGNELANVYTFEACDFYRVSSADGSVSDDGDSLVIVKSGESPSASNKNKVTIPNFPFSQDKAFGFSLGKVRDGVDTVSKAYSNFGSMFYPTKESFGSFIVNQFDSYGNSIVKFDSTGVELSRYKLDENYVTHSTQHLYESNGKNFMLVPFESKDISVDPITSYRVGVALIDCDSGEMLSKGIFADSSVDSNLEFLGIFGGLLNKEEPDYFYAAYRRRTKDNRNYDTHCVQKFRKSDMQPEGNPVLYSWSRYSQMLSDYGGARKGYEIFSFTLENEVKVTKKSDYKTLVFESPKYRDFAASEIKRNYNVDGGTHRTDPSVKSSAISLSSEADVELMVAPSSDSNMVIIRGDVDELQLGNSNPNIKINFPVTNPAQISFYTIDANAVSLEQLMGGSYDKGLLRPAISNSRRLEGQISANATDDAVGDDGYYYDGEYYYDPINDDGIASSGNSTHTVMVLPNNQTIVLYGANATDVVLASEKYFSTLGDIEVFPTQLPTSSPSEHKNPTSQPSRNIPPSSRPSGLPSQNPNSKPSSNPSSNPSQNPNALPSSNPSGLPSAYPSSDPSSDPTLDPTYYHPSSRPSVSPTGVKYPTSVPSKKTFTPSLEPTIEETDFPTFEPSEELTNSPTSHPSKQKHPSSRPSGLPSQNPNSKPSSNPSSNPSQNPNALPSSNPSGLPSSYPSSDPSSDPTLDPTYYHPSSRPSVSPTGVKYPTSLPSRNVPSFQPSLATITESPTELEIEESNSPTFEPSQQEITQTNPPTALPSAQDDNFNSRSPTIRYVENNSSSPTSFPSIAGDLITASPSSVIQSSSPTLNQTQGGTFNTTTPIDEDDDKEEQIDTFSPTILEDIKATFPPTIQNTFPPIESIPSFPPTAQNSIIPTIGDGNQENEVRPSTTVVTVSTVTSIAAVGLALYGAYRWLRGSPQRSKTYVDVVANREDNDPENGGGVAR